MGPADRIGAALETALPALRDRVVRRIRAEIAVYEDGELVPVELLRESVDDNVGFMIAALTTSAVDLSVPEATGRARALAGAPLVDLLSAYRVGFAEMWASVVATARALPDVPDRAVVDLAGTVFDLQNRYCDAVIAGYRAETQQLARTQERERTVLVEAVLGSGTEQGTLWDAAQALRLPLDGVFLVVAARAELGHDPMPRVESALAARDVRSVWRLEPDLSLGVLSLADRERAGLAIDVLDRHARGPVGASPVFTELRRSGRALRMARLALDTHSGAAAVEQIRDRPLTMLLAAAPQAAMEAARTVLADLLDLPDDDRDLLLATFDAWVDAAGSAQDAATALFVHPNTVRYRLRRIEAATGRSLGHPAELAELVAAVRAWAQLRHVTATAG